MGCSPSKTQVQVEAGSEVVKGTHLCVHIHACMYEAPTRYTCDTHCFISGLEKEGRKKGRRQRRKHWVFISFHYKGCKGTKTKASTPEDRQGPAECALSRPPQPATGTHTRGPWDIHSRVYMLGVGRCRASLGTEGHRWGRAQTNGFAYIRSAAQPLGGSFLGGAHWGGGWQWTLDAKALPPGGWWRRPWHCPLVPVGKRSEVTG